MGSDIGGNGIPCSTGYGACVNEAMHNWYLMASCYSSSLWVSVVLFERKRGGMAMRETRNFGDESIVDKLPDVVE